MLSTPEARPPREKTHNLPHEPKIRAHGNILGVSLDTYHAINGVTTEMLGLIAGIIGSKITPEHMHDLERLFEAREDLIADREFALSIGTDETLREFRSNKGLAELENFFEEFSHLNERFFGIIFEAQPDSEMARLYHMIKGQFGKGYYVEKVERVIAFGYLQDFIASCVRQHPELVNFHNESKVDKVPTRIGFYLANIMLMSLRQKGAVVEV